MKTKIKYVNPIAIYFLVYIFGTFLLLCGSTIARYLYAYLNSLFPAIFPIFSPISEKDGYDSYIKLIDIVAAFIAVYLTNYLALRFDNSKFEFMTSKTGGQYRLSEGITIYEKEFWLSDIISGTLFPLVLTLAPYLIPNVDKTEVPIVNFLIVLLNSFFWLGGVMEEHCNIFTSAFLIIMASLVSRILCTLSNLKRWRAVWLSGSLS